MKTTKYTIALFLFSLALLTTTFAQLDVKDGDDNILLQVNDYGDAGTLFLPPFGPILPGLPINNQMLYNFEGTLYWNGSALGTSNSAAGWMRPIPGGKIYPTDLADKVGIGTTNPLSKLSVGGQGEPDASISGIASSTNTGVYGTSDNGHGVYGKSNDGRGVYGEATGEQSFGVYGISSNAGSLLAHAGVYGRADGNAGYGVQGYSESSFGVYGKSVGSQGVGIYGFATSSSGIGVKGNATGASGYGGYFSGRGYFSDNVGIGETSPGYKLHVKDDQSNNFVARIENTSIGTDADGLAILLNVGTPVSSNHFIRFQKAGGVNVGNITGNGSGGVQYNTTSDARLKMNIKEYSNALNVLSRIGVKKYERIANPGIEEIGVIAQELQEVYPQAVSGSPDSDVKTDPMMVDYSKLTPLLVKGMQEQQEIIKKLEDRLTKLEKLLDGVKFTSASK